MRVGYAACFEGALKLVARRDELTLGEVSVDSRVGLTPNSSGGFDLSVVLDVAHHEIADDEQAVAVVRAAHQMCLYSNATRGKIPVALTANGGDVD